jgi:hypothetical protein
MNVTGIFIRRKSFGRQLAFATLKVISIENDENGDGEGNSWLDGGGNSDIDGRDNSDGTLIESFNGIEIETIKDETMQILCVNFIHCAILLCNLFLYPPYS